MTPPIAGSRFCGLCADWVLRSDMQEETKRQMADLEAEARGLRVSLLLAEDRVEELEEELERTRLAIALAPGFAKGKTKRAGVA